MGLNRAGWSGRWVFLLLGLAGVLLPAVSEAADATLTRGPYLQQVTPGSIIVRWSTGELVDSRVAYGSDPGALSTEVVVGGSTTDHEVPLANLSPDTRYYYAVGTSTHLLAGGDTDHFFDTAPPSGTPKPTRIWVLGDSGLPGNPQQAVRDAYYDYTDDVAGGGANARDTDVVLLLGDNAYPEGTQQEYQLGMFEPYFEMLRKSVFWPVLGNHDKFDEETQT
jgi:phosphodiesterase/alkaline phosphatase D-like protein